MANVFLSYQKRDQDLARRIAEALRGEGFTVWWDDDLTPRESWDRTIEREIAACDSVLVLWTRNSVESDWVRIEANYARNCAPSKLVQARFDHSNVPIAFSMTQYVDIDYDLPEASASWLRLLHWLRSDEPPVAPPSASAPPSFPPPLPLAEPAAALRPPRSPSARFTWRTLAGCAVFALIGLAFLLFLRSPSDDADDAAYTTEAAIAPAATALPAAAVPAAASPLVARKRTRADDADAGDDDAAAPDAPDLPDVAAITAAAQSEAAAARSQAAAETARALRDIHRR